ncbi:hypothetical protein ABPG75_012406 [Micractinium tetrahymenae]
MSLQALQLLQGPTRLAVGVLSGATAADLLLVSPARCYVARPAYDEEVFKASACRSMYGTLREQQLASSKPKRPVGVAAAMRLATPGHLAVTFGRNIGLTVLITFNKWLLAALEEEEKAEDEGRESEMPPLEVAELQAACVKGAYNSCVDLAVQGTRCVLDAAAVQRLQPGLAKKLIKDLRQSVARKGKLPWHSRVPRVAKTAFYSDATFWAADFLVSCCLEAYHAAKAAATKAAGWPQLLQRLLLRCGLHAARAGLVLAAVAAGNGVGSAVPRARGLSMWAVSMAASFLVNGYMLSFMNRLAPLAEPAPDGGAGAAAGGGAPAGAAPGGGFVMIGQQVHPAATAAMAAAAAAAAAAAGEAAGGEHLANGAPERADAAAGPGGAAEVLAGGGGAVGAAAARAAAAADAADDPAAGPLQQQDAAVQAGGPGAAEPPIPAPQQRRVVGGPRLPDRPARRNAAAGPDAAPVLPQQPLAPPPAAPHTPQFRDQRAPTPAGDSEEAELRAAAAAAAAGASPAGSEAPGAASPAPASGSSSADVEAAAAEAAAEQQHEQEQPGGAAEAAAPGDGEPVAA